MSFIAAFLLTTPVLFLLVMLFIYPKKLVESIESLLREIAAWTRQELRDICQFAGVLNENALITKDGDLVSIIELSGSLGIVGDEEFWKILSQLKNVNNAHIRPHTEIQWVFESTSDITNRLEPARRSMEASAKRIGLSIDDLLTDEIKAVSAKGHDERTYIVVKSSPKTPIKELMAEYRKEKSAAGLDGVSFSETISLPIIEHSLADTHESTVGAVIDAAKAAKMLSSRMSVENILKVIKEALDPDFVGSFHAKLPTNGVAPSVVYEGDRFSPYAPIWRQICSNNIENTSSASVVRIKGTYYGSGWMELPPQSEKSFKSLLNTIKDIPFRMSFRMYPEGLKMNSFDKTLVSLFSLFKKSHNRKIKEAYDEMEEMKAAGDSDLGVSISFTTWAKTESECLSQLASLCSKVRSWGVADIQTDCGDAVELFLSVIPAFTNLNPTKIMPLPTSFISSMLPVFSPASIWGLDSGGVLFTEDAGKVLPFAVGSSSQKGWVYLIYSQIGSGKSVLLNTLELGACLRAGMQRLPLMVIIDVGESVLGLVGMLKDSLPESRQHEALYVKLQMRNEYAVNMMDTQLGYRRPLPEEREMIVNFISLLVTPAGLTKPYASVYELAGMAVDEAYTLYSDEKSPKKYERDQDARVDSAMDKGGLMTDNATSWWEVADALFQYGFINESALAQRYAMPLLSDLPKILASQQIQDLFKGTKVAETEEPLSEFMTRMISTSLRDYPVFSRPTVFDVGSSRVVGLDLGNVRGANSDAGKKQTALMYLFAQSLATRSFYLHEDMLRDIPRYCPEAYRAHHEARIKDVSEELKVVGYDEFHNTGGIDSVRRAVGLNIREGRKFSIMVALSSQMIDDFDKDMIENASGIFVMSADSPITVENTKKLFGLTDSETKALTEKVTSIGVFLGIFNTKEGRAIHVMKNILSPSKYWAFTTTSEDKAIKKYLGKKLGVTEARKLLSKNYPYGIKSDLERIKFADNEDGLNDAIGQMAEKLLIER